MTYNLRVAPETTNENKNKTKKYIINNNRPIKK